MSKNFELLQKLDRDRQARNGARPGEFSHDVCESTATLDDLPRPILACERPSTKIGEAIRVEISKLIHRLFLTSELTVPSSMPQHAVVFSGFEQSNGPGRVTGITSDMLAEQAPNMKVCVVDADFHNPSLHDHFGIPNGIGFTDALRDPAVTCHFTRRLTNNLWIMSCGAPSRRTNGHSQISSETAQAVMEDLRRNFDYVLITAGNIAGSNNAIVLGHAARGVIMVIEANCTRREIAEKYKRSFQAANVRVLGAVLHNRTFPIPQSLYALL